MVYSVTLKTAQIAAVPQRISADAARPAAQAVATEKPTQNISLATALAQKGPPFDAERVATLRAAISSGSYRIDLGAIADGVIRFGSKTPV